MPICARCGFLIRGPRERCEKCGAPLSRRRGEEARALAESVARAAEEFAPAAAAAPSPWPRRLGWAALALLLVGLAGWAGRTAGDRAAIPVGPGAAWRFAMEGQEGVEVRFAVEGSPSTGRGLRVRVDLVEAGKASLLGFGTVARRWRGLDVLEVEQAGAPPSTGDEVRLLPFPFGPGRRWRARVGGGRFEERFRLEFETGDMETVRVPAGRYEALPVRFALSGPLGPPLLRGSYHVARGAGPVQVSLEVPGGFRGLRSVELRLVEGPGP